MIFWAVTYENEYDGPLGETTFFEDREKAIEYAENLAFKAFRFQAKEKSGTNSVPFHAFLGQEHVACSMDITEDGDTEGFVPWVGNYTGGHYFDIILFDGTIEKGLTLNGNWFFRDVYRWSRNSVVYIRQTNQNNGG